MSSKEQRIEHWTRLIGDQQSSGLSMAAWCRTQTIPFSTFDYWRRQIFPVPSAKNVARSPKNHPSPEWLSVSLSGGPSVISASGNSTPDMLCLRVGKVSVDVVPGFNSTLLADVLCVLESRC